MHLHSRLPALMFTASGTLPTAESGFTDALLALCPALTEEPWQHQHAKP